MNIRAWNGVVEAFVNAVHHLETLGSKFLVWNRIPQVWDRIWECGCRVAIVGLGFSCLPLVLLRNPHLGLEV